MLYEYYLRRDVAVGDDGEAREVYGISAIGEDGAVLASVPDIFFDVKRARAFVDVCNREGLSLIHLADAVDDVLAEEYGI